MSKLGTLQVTAESPYASGATVVDMAAAEHCGGHSRKLCQKIIFPSYSTPVHLGGRWSTSFLETSLLLIHIINRVLNLLPPPYSGPFSFVTPVNMKQAPKPLKKNQKETRVHCLFTPHCEGGMPPPSAGDALCRHLFIVNSHQVLPDF